jgi:hypothetical protein
MTGRDGGEYGSILSTTFAVTSLVGISADGTSASGFGTVIVQLFVRNCETDTFSRGTSVSDWFSKLGGGMVPCVCDSVVINP